jgi:polyhydroxybutyrate depolymerase
MIHLLPAMKKVYTSIFFLYIFVASVAQVMPDSLLIENHFRSFYFDAPKADARDFDIVFVLHGSGGTGLDMVMPAKKLQAISSEQHMLLVYANGYKNFWNECRKAATSEANKIDINEQAFFNGMLSYFHNRYKTNNKRFFVIGLSGGGHMAYKLAMTMPDKCEGISAVVANVPDTTNLDCAAAGKAVAVMISNGTADKTNPYNGGNMTINGSSWGEVRSTERSFHYWASVAGYSGDPLVTEVPDTIKNEQTITRYTYHDKNRPEVTLLKVNGGQHTFPQDLDIFLESLQFFKREIARLKTE